MISLCPVHISNTSRRPPYLSRKLRLLHQSNSPGLVHPACYWCLANGAQQPPHCACRGQAGWRKLLSDGSRQHCTYTPLGVRRRGFGSKLVPAGPCHEVNDAGMTISLSLVPLSCPQSLTFHPVASRHNLSCWLPACVPRAALRAFKAVIDPPSATLSSPWLAGQRLGSFRPARHQKRRAGGRCLEFRHTP